MLLPDDLTLPLMWLGLLVNLLHRLVPLQDAVLGAMAGYGVLWLIYWIFKLATGKEAWAMATSSSWPRWAPGWAGKPCRWSCCWPRRWAQCWAWR
jgi:leader peptidase (prepilin peptidase)/N-methyltransferase